MISQRLLKQHFSYNPISGEFIKISNNKKVGGKSNNYIGICFRGKVYYAHRLAFLYMEGRIPKFVDHVDMNGFNNKWDNLRETTSSQNHGNIKKQKNNTTGYKGVFYSCSKYNPFMSRIKANKVIIYIGLFKTAELAAKAYDQKAIELFGEFAATNFPIDKIQK